MKIGELGFELDDSVMRARNVAGPASACPVALRRRDCGLANRWMTPNAEVVVRAPNSHVALFLGAVRAPDRGREASRVAVEVDEDPISSLVLQALDRIGEMRSCSLVECRPTTLRAWAYFETLTHCRTLPERRQGG
jgi:hypothetical protein